MLVYSHGIIDLDDFVITPQNITNLRISRQCIPCRIATDIIFLYDINPRPRPPCPFQSPYKDLRYLMMGESGIIQYFMVDELTGDVSLKKSVMEDPNGRTGYNVSIISLKRCWSNRFEVCDRKKTNYPSP